MGTAGYYGIPSGFRAFGEFLEECAWREVEEEAGIRMRELHFLDWMIMLIRCLPLFVVPAFEPALRRSAK